MNHPAIQQYSFHKSANNRVFDRLHELPDEVYNQQIKSIYNSIKEVLIHMYQTDGMWLSVLAGDDFPQTMKIIKQLQKESANQPLTVIKKFYKDMNERYESFLIGNEALDQPVEIIHPNFGELDTTVTEMVKHVVNHGTYHRGNIAAMFRHQGHAGVSMDFFSSFTKNLNKMKYSS